MNKRKDKRKKPKEINKKINFRKVVDLKNALAD